MGKLKTAPFRLELLEQSTGAKAKRTQLTEREAIAEAEKKECIVAYYGRKNYEKI